MEFSSEKAARQASDLLLCHVEAGQTEAHETIALLQAELLATVSHELRSPLTAIKGYAATLLLHEHRITPAEQREFLLTIKSACERLEGLIAQMLEIAHLEAGQVELQLSPVNPVYLVNEAIMAAEQRYVVEQADRNTGTIPGKTIFTLAMENEQGLSANEAVVIQADRRLLEKLFFHLFENARRYAPEGSLINVTLRIVPLSEGLLQRKTLSERNEDTGECRTPEILTTPAEDTPMIEICVSDQGRGIAPEHLERIFERFSHVDTRLTREGGGLGLGLAICRHIVALHGGRIWAESEVGKGSTFCVQLPVGRYVY